MAIKTVKVQINGIWTTLTLNSTTGKYEGTMAAPNITSFNKTGGYYPLLVEATDLAGNVTTKTDTDLTLGDKCKLYVKEITKPTIIIMSPTANAYVTNNKSPIIFQLRDEANGSGIKISTLKLKIDENSFTNVSTGMTINTVSNGYDVTYMPQTALSDGIHTIMIDIEDNDGNTANQATRTFTVDTVPPELSITSPEESMTYTNQPTFIIKGHTNDSTSSPVTVTIKLNGSDQGTIDIDGTGKFEKSITLTEGTNNVAVRATDAAGKYSEITYTIVLDILAPTVNNITITPNPVVVGNSYTITVDISDE